jgi:hypothetical protein
VATPDTRHSIVILKQFGYRGATRTFSNRYHFEGALPPDTAHWTTLADNIVTAEKAIFGTDVTIVQATGYDSGTATSTNPHGNAVFTKSYTTVGTFSPATGDVTMPGDAAALLRYTTPARTPKNHPVYLFNYFHGCFRQPSTSDELAHDQKAVIETYGGSWVTGFTDGAIVHERCGPRGAVSTGHRVDTYVRHRDFPV